MRFVFFLSVNQSKPSNLTKTEALKSFRSSQFLNLILGWFWIDSSSNVLGRIQIAWWNEMNFLMLGYLQRIIAKSLGRLNQQKVAEDGCSGTKTTAAESVVFLYAGTQMAFVFRPGCCSESNFISLFFLACIGGETVQCWYRINVACFGCA